VNFNLYVSIETFEKYQQELQSFLVGPPSVSLPASDQRDLDCHATRKCVEIVSPPRVSVPDPLGERGHDADPNSISPLRQFDVSNITALRSLLVNPHSQQSSAISSQPSLFAHEDPSHSNAWTSAISSYESPRSLTSYPSTHPSPTSTTTTACQKQLVNHFTGDAECMLMYQSAISHPPQPMARSNPSLTLTIPTGADIHHLSGPSVPVPPPQQPQKYSSRQRLVTHPNPSPAVMQSQQQQQHHNPRAVFPYQARYAPQHSSYDTTGSSHALQHYDVSGNGNGYNPPPQQAHFPHPAAALAYHPTCGAYFPNQNAAQLPFCPVPCKNYGGNQMAFAGLSYPPPAPPMQYMTGGYYYHQPIPPSQMGPGPRYLAPSSTPNSVADMFGPNKNEVPPPHQHLSSFPQPEEFMQRAAHQPMGGRCASGSHPYPMVVGVGGMQHQQYYPWNEQQDLIGFANGNVPHFQHHHSGMPASDANSYPASALFYPMPLRTVS
jgi:hypothetical protein